MRPVTEDQWRDAVDAAELLARITTAKALLILELGRLFGLIDESGEVDIQACNEVIEEGRIKGIVPSAVAVHRFLTY